MNVCFYSWSWTFVSIFDNEHSPVIFDFSSAVSILILASLTIIGSPVFIDSCSLTIFRVSRGSPSYNSKIGVLFAINFSVILLYPYGKSDCREYNSVIGTVYCTFCSYLQVHSDSLEERLTRNGIYAFLYIQQLRLLLSLIGDSSLKDCSFYYGTAHTSNTTRDRVTSI